MIHFEHTGYAYSKGTPFEMRALYDVTTTFEDGKYYAVIGHTGSGKSTLIQHLNGLLQPTEGSVTIGDLTVTGKTRKKFLPPLRKKVGIVFQFAEQQLFEETVLRDITFGPKNFGVDDETAKKKAYELADMLKIDHRLMDQSPFELSGGQMRRVAIAGVLAMEPDILVLDEPTAGLDPSGQREIMAIFERIHQATGITVILVTHQMEQAAHADEIRVMHQGHIVMQGPPQKIFAEDLSPFDLMPPKIVQLQRAVEEKHNMKFPELALSIDAFAVMYKEWRTHHAR